MFLNLLLLISTVVSQNEVVSDLVKDKIQGRVRTVMTSEYNVPEGIPTWRRDKVLSQTITSYDANGVEVMKYINTEGGKVSHRSLVKRDSKGNIIERTVYKGDNSILSRTVVKYRYPLTVSTQYDADSVRHVSTVSVYDEKYNIVRQVIYDFVGIGESRTNYVYDTSGNIIGAHTVRKDGKTVSRFTYKYNKPDDAGNWQERVTYVGDKPVKVLERIMDYYK